MRKRQIFYVLSCLLIVLTNLTGFSQDGMPDSSFGNGGTVVINLGSSNEYGNGMALQPDGKIVICGSSDVIFNGDDLALIRLNTDGSLDTSFNGTGHTTTQYVPSSEDIGFTVAIQPDGKIVVGGNTVSTNARDFTLFRYNQNGSLDTTFGVGGIAVTSLGYNDACTSIVLQPDGKIIANYNSNSMSFPYQFQTGIIRFQNNGSIDTAFGYLGRCYPPLSVNLNCYSGQVLLRNNGKINLSGTFDSISTQNIFVTQFNSDGLIDSSFGVNGICVINYGKFQRITSATFQPDDKILLGGGEFDSSGFKNAIYRITSYGTPDSTFGLNGKATSLIDSVSVITSVLIQPDNKILTAGVSYDTTYQSTYCLLTRYNSKGAIDSTFGINGFVKSKRYNSDEFRKVLLQSDGKIIAAGTTRDSLGRDFLVSRFFSGLSIGIINNNKHENKIFVYPNPVNDIISIRYNLSKSEKVSIVLFDMLGKSCQSFKNNISQSIGEHTEQFAINKNLPPGNYILRLETLMNSVTIKIVKL